MKTLDQKLDNLITEATGRLQALEQISLDEKMTLLTAKIRLRIAELKNLKQITQLWIEFPPPNSSEENVLEDDKKKLAERIRTLTKDTTSCGNHSFVLE